MFKTKITLKTFYPTFILLIALVLVGLGLYWFNDSEIFWPGYVVMVIFYCLMFFLGSYAATLKDVKNTDDILLAGRNLPVWVGIFTMTATWVGGGYINGTAESTFDVNSGLTWVQAPWGYGLSLIFGGLVFAKKMRRYRFKTLLDPLNQRFGRKMSILLFIPALSGEIFWTSAILTALGATFATILGLDIKTGIIISSIVTISYTALGGLWAVALTDVLQLILLAIGLVIVLPFALDAVGGWEHVWNEYTQRMGASANILPSKEALGARYYNWWDSALLLIFGGIPWQVYFQRVLSSKTPKVAQRLSIYAGVLCIIAAIPPIMIGVIGQSVPSWEALGAPPLDNSALVLPYVMRYLTPEIVATIGLGAIVAAVMSSVDSSILSASSMTGWNVYRPLFKPNISSEKLTKVIQKCVWIIGVTAVILALNVTSVYDLWVLASDLVFVLIFPQLVTALFDKKANFWGSLSGFFIGFILRFGGGEATFGIPPIINYPMIHNGEVLFPFRTLAMVSTLITIIIVSRVTQKISPPKKLFIA